jgi:hypothetical protein
LSASLHELSTTPPCIAAKLPVFMADNLDQTEGLPSEEKVRQQTRIGDTNEERLHHSHMVMSNRA